ncbi:hypothetical protein [Tenacibaculum sp. C7A-26P2]|uniref:hypothetical protein n=1 Tax=Tenacibaculum sp. C7A-26P2 TaxID=3447504 RepID=UPI003F865876
MVEIGKPITEEQKSLLHRLLDTKDLVDISATVDVSYSTVRSIYYRTQTITEDNKEAIYKMINKAFEKSEDAIVYFTKAKSELEAMLPKITS